MEDAGLKWHKSTYSSNGGGNCVEVGDRASRVLVRDTKDRSGPVLRVSAAAWRRFADQVKRSLEDHNTTSRVILTPFCGPGSSSSRWSMRLH